MKKKLEDYLHLYQGIDCQVDGGHIGKMLGYTARGLGEEEMMVFYTIQEGDDEEDWTVYNDDKHMQRIKPILWKLSDMTDEQKKEIYFLIFKKPFHPAGRIKWFAKANQYVEPRWVLMVGLDRMGIEMNGTVWADCDLNNLKYNQHEITRYLLLKHFDLFGLIEAGLAIDKATIHAVAK
jgi:hypothetical protein